MHFFPLFKSTNALWTERHKNPIRKQSILFFRPGGEPETRRGVLRVSCSPPCLEKKKKTSGNQGTLKSVFSLRVFPYCSPIDNELKANNKKKKKR